MPDDAHAAVRHELLVRYLDTWLPAALHGHKRVTYVDTDVASAIAAARVICEFEDLIRRHTVTMVVAGIERSDEVLATCPDGLTIRPAAGPLLSALRDARSLKTPTFAWLHGAVPADLVSTVASSRGSELLLSGASAETPMESVLHKAGLEFLARIELVDRHGRTEPLLFATASEKALETFKDELWALDEYAGIRLRDPGDPSRTLLDISERPPVSPLRRALLGQLAQSGPAPLSELRRWGVRETIFRSADVTRAVQALLTSGLATRDPIGGRLSPDTVIAAAGTAEPDDPDLELEDTDIDD
jgi:hypothetical protein